jgi:putative transposase
MKKLNHKNTCVFNIGYHIIWCPKYRRKVLINNVEKDLRDLLYLKSIDINVKIENMEIMPDHVHLFVKGDPTISVDFIVKSFKGFTSRVLRIKHKHLNKLPSLWTHSYYCETIGHISEDTVKKYIEEQKRR